MNDQEKEALEKFRKPAAPALSAADEAKTFEVLDGFKLELVAAEPLVTAPVSMCFDERGRMWVVEMTGYMPDADGTNETDPVGSIVILEDTNHDGQFDKRIVFLDKLVMPRAMTLVKGGILFCEPPKLWFVANQNDVPGERVLVDAAYCGGGNPEHQTNGLTRGIDNALYNAAGSKRYRAEGSSWVSDSVGTRGQWGICQDDWGRLFYNNNSNILMCDEAPAGWLMRNPKFNPARGLGLSVAPNQNVFLTEPTPGVNRAYMLDEKGRLKTFTGACSPCIYRGDLFPQAYQGNAFACEPVANVIRRMVLAENESKVTGAVVNTEREFIRSSDERFRPVALSNGPDGALYVVDFYRGIIQHKVFLTRFLRQQYDERELAKPLNAGRIWRLVPGNKPAVPAKLNLAAATDAELVTALEHPNGWWRDTAQRLLVERGAASAVPALAELAKSSKLAQARIHALWTLQGMGRLTPEMLVDPLRNAHPKVASHALRLAGLLAAAPGGEKLLPEVIRCSQDSRWEVRFSAALVAGVFPQPEGLATAKALLVAHSKDDMIRSAVLSSLGNRPLDYANFMKDTPALAKLTQAPASAKPTRKVEGEEKKRWERGASVFGNYCVGCHQPGGDGLAGIAPPLTKSEWVQGDPAVLGSIILSGLQGPVRVNGKTYQSPDIMPLMPGHAAVPEITDPVLADLMTYLRNTFKNDAEPVSAEILPEVRKAALAHPVPFTPEELRPRKK